MKGTLIVVILALNLVVGAIQAESGAGIDANQSGGQLQQVDLPSISQLRFAIRKFNLPKGLECQVFATKVLPLVGQQQAAAANQAQKDATKLGIVLGQLAHFIESQPAWDGLSSNSGKRILLEYINHCISSLDGATSPVVEVPVVVPLNEQQTSKPQDEIELLRRQVAELEKARDGDADKAKKANQLEAERTSKKCEELIVSYKNQLQSYQTDQEELKRKLSASEEQCNDLLVGNTDTKDSISQLEMKVSSYKEKEDKCQRDYNTLKAQMDEQERKLLMKQHKLTKDLDVSSSQLSDARDRETELRQHIEGLSSSKLEEAKKCAEREEELRKNIENITSSISELAEAKSAKDMLLEGVGKKYEELIVSHQNQLQHWQADQEELKRKLSTSEKQYNNLLVGNMDAKDSISQLKMEVSTYKQKEDKCHRDYNTLMTQMDELTKDVDVCRSQLSDAKNREAHLKQQVEGLSNQSKLAEAKNYHELIHRLTGPYNDLVSANNELQTELYELEKAKHMETEGADKKVNELIVSLQTGLQSCQADHEDLERLLSVYENLRMFKIDSKELLAQLEMRLTTYKQKEDNCQRNYNMLRAQMDEQERKLSMKQQELGKNAQHSDLPLKNVQDCTRQVAGSSNNVEPQDYRSLEEANEQLKRRVAELKRTRDMELGEANKRANELVVSLQTKLRDCQAKQENLKRTLSGNINILVGNIDTKELIARLEMRVTSYKQKEEKCQRDYNTLKIQMKDQERNLLMKQQELIRDVELCNQQLRDGKKCSQRVDELREDIAEDPTLYKMKQNWEKQRQNW